MILSRKKTTTQKSANREEEVGTSLVFPTMHCTGRGKGSLYKHYGHLMNYYVPPPVLKDAYKLERKYMAVKLKIRSTLNNNINQNVGVTLWAHMIGCPISCRSYEKGGHWCGVIGVHRPQCYIPLREGTRLKLRLKERWLGFFWGWWKRPGIR